MIRNKQALMWKWGLINLAYQSLTCFRFRSSSITSNYLFVGLLLFLLKSGVFHIFLLELVRSPSFQCDPTTVASLPLENCQLWVRQTFRRPHYLSFVHSRLLSSFFLISFAVSSALTAVAFPERFYLESMCLQRKLLLVSK